VTLAIILISLAVVLLGTGLVILQRRRRPALQASPVRAAMPTVLVDEVVERPVLTEAPPTLGERLGSSRSVFERVRTLAVSGLVSAEQLDVVEEVLLRSDVGVATTAVVLDELRANGAPNGVAATVRTVLLDSFNNDRTVVYTAKEGFVPVWLFVGVNGVGKTTTIGKLAQREVNQGRSVVLAAGDTFRAAAADQLQEWATRTGADIVRAGEGADPGSVVHDALGRAAARGADIVLADTAGRRANNTNLLDELSKVRRVADRAPGQVVETFMVLDATTGQNALSQAREFLAAATVTGIARGGIVVAIERELGIPVKFVGVGEAVGDLIAFEPVAFVDSLLNA
jgi:fused signal recognition particle receptor